MKIEEKDILDFKKNITLQNKACHIINKPFYAKSPRISFLIIVKNEERVIKRCINSILTDMNDNDEIIIVDTGSKDDTIEIIKSFKQDNVQLLHFKWNDNFSEVRNFAKKYAKNEWLFYIDADEYITNSSIIKLKKYISILQKHTDHYIFINPTISNTNDHIINGVTRIFENKSNIKYKGLVHEYPYVEDGNFSCYSFESVLLIHDGYDNNVIDMNKKIERNMKLLKKMQFIEEDIRWDYLYCRDGSYKWNEEKQIKNLKKLLKKWESEKESDTYYAATRDLIELYLITGNIDMARNQVSILEKLNFNESDLLYFSSILSWHNIKLKENELLNELIDYRKSRKYIDYGALHSNYFHIDFLISQLLFSQGEMEKSYTIQKKLNNKGVFDYTIDFEQIIKIALKIKGNGEV